MGWTETTRRQRIGREVAARIEQDGGLGEVTWDDSWSEVFTGPEDLLAHLSLTWRRQVEGQVDPSLDRLAFARARVELDRRHEGLRTLLQRRGVVVVDVA